MEQIIQLGLTGRVIDITAPPRIVSTEYSNYEENIMHGIKRVVSEVAGLVVAGFLAAWPAGVHAQIWVAGPSQKVARPEKAPATSAIWDAGQKQVNLFAACNEFVAFQIVFPGPMKDVNVAPFTLQGPGGKTLDGVELFREHYMLCKVLTQYSAKQIPADVQQLADTYEKKQLAARVPGSTRAAPREEIRRAIRCQGRVE